MATFLLKGRDPSGKEGEILFEADSRSGAIARARSEGWLVLSAEMAEGERSLYPPPWHFSWLFRMTAFDVEIGLRQIASMLKSGVPLVESLHTAEEQARNPRSKSVWREIYEKVLAGNSFGDALSGRSGKFGEITIQLARIGERTGELDFALEKAAQHLEARRNLKSMVVNALIYPILAIALAVGVSVFLTVSVIPKIAAFLQSGGAALPPVTQSLIDISDWLIANGAGMLVAVSAAVAAWFLARLSPAGREIEDLLLLRLPVTGKVVRLSLTALFARAMETMLMSGVTLLDSLEVASRLTGNARLGKRIETVRKETIRGKTFSAALGDAVEFMPMLRRMAAIGEKTGSLAANMGETARFYEMMLSVLIRRFSVIIEPVIICVTGVIVGYVYIAFFTAVFSMANAG